MNKIHLSFLLASAIILSACGNWFSSSSVGVRSPSTAPSGNTIAAPTSAALVPDYLTNCDPESSGLTQEEISNCGLHSYDQMINSLTISRTNACGLFIGQQDKEDSILPSEGKWQFIFHKGKVAIRGDDWDAAACASSFIRRENNKYECKNLWGDSAGHTLSVLTFSLTGFTLKKYVYGDPGGVFNGLCGSMTMTLVSSSLEFVQP